MLSDTAPPREKCGSGFAVCQNAELTAASRVDDSTTNVIGAMGIPDPFPRDSEHIPSGEIAGNAG